MVEGIYSRGRYIERKEEFRKCKGASQKVWESIWRRDQRN